MECAFDGVEGERRALTSELDLVLVDWMLPGRHGLAILAMIHQRKANLPVIMLSAKAERADRAAALDAGAVDYLIKPFTFAELTARIREHLPGRGAEKT